MSNDHNQSDDFLHTPVNRPPNSKLEAMLFESQTNEALPDLIGNLVFEQTTELLEQGGDWFDAKYMLHEVDMDVAYIAACRKMGAGDIKLTRKAVADFHFAAVCKHQIQTPEATAALERMTEPHLSDYAIRMMESMVYNRPSGGLLVESGGFIIGRSLRNSEEKGQKWLVDGIIPRKGLTMLYGQTGVGKSYAAIDLAFAVRNGRPWGGCEGCEADVLYVATEDPLGIDDRNEAIADYLGLPEGLKPLIVAGEFDLSRGSESVSKLLKKIRRANWESLGLVVVDTLQMSLGGAEENSASEATEIIKNCRLLSDCLDCTVLLVHHSGKDSTKNARGSSAFTAAMDTVITMTNNQSGVTLKVVKQKNGPGGLQCTGKLLPMSDGEGCYLQLEDWSDGVSEPRKVGKAPLSEIVLGLVTRYCDRNNCGSVSRSQITDMILELPDWKDKSRDTVRKALQRAIDQLVSDELLSATHTAVQLTETISTH